MTYLLPLFHSTCHWTFFSALPGVNPRDIPLPLPLPGWFIIGALVLSFLMHILFVNLLVGGSLLTLWAELKGRKDPAYDRLARQIAATVTVNKSLAVVLGVAPLLCINTIYTVFFYTANSLTGNLWISIIPLVTIGFLLLYWHKYSWEKYKYKKTFHLGILGAALVILLFVPLIFLANINLMLFPAEWASIKGSFSALFLSNVLPRYLHFLCASLAVTGLFLVGYMKRRAYPFQEIFQGLSISRRRVLKLGYRLALFASLAQLLLGPLNLFTLPWHAVTWGLAHAIIAGTVLALTAIVLLWKEIKGPEHHLGKRFYLIVLLLSITVLFMGTGRHIYRAVALHPHQKKIEHETAHHRELVQEAAEKKQGTGT